MLAAIGNREKLIDYEKSSWEFFKIGKTQEEFIFVDKWSYRLQSDVWDEMKRRKKISEIEKTEVKNSGNG